MYAFDRNIIETVRHKDENGFLHVDISNITKEAVNPYYGREIPDWQTNNLDPDKIYYGYRPLGELEKAADSFNNLPILDIHKQDGANIDENKKIRIGSLGTDSQIVKPYLRNSLVFYDQNAIDDVEAERRKELSCAYRYKPVFKTGFFNGQRYDFLMSDIRGNHVALVKEGRAGSDVVVADSNTIKEGVKMSKLSEKLAKLRSSKKTNIAMDEDIEQAVEELVAEKVDEVVERILEEKVDAMKEPETVEVREKITADADNVDKRKLIDEIGGILRGKVSDELIRTIMAKAEELAYNDSETSADDSDIPAKDEEPKTTVKVKEERVHAMDENSIKNKIRSEMKELYDAAEDVRLIIGSVSPLAFDSAEQIYGKALELEGYDIKKYPTSSYRSMFEVHKKAKHSSPQMSFDADTVNGLEKRFPNLANIKIGV